MEERKKQSKLLKSQDTSELQALIRLLDDPDEKVFSNVSQRLKNYGTEIIPELEGAWETQYEPEIQSRIEDIIHSIQFSEVFQDFIDYLETDPENLLKGAILVARYRYPDTDEAELLGQIEKIRRAVWLELNYDLTPFEQINVINRVFFGFFGFKAEYYSQFDPKAFFLPQVLEAKRGSSLIVSILYMIVAQELDIPIYGVHIPMNFSIAYCHDFIEHFAPEDDYRMQVQFYINPLNKGQVFSENEIGDYLKKMRIPNDESFFKPIDNKHCIKLLLADLKKTFEADKAYPRIEEITMLMRLF
ncbi:MAG: transglutaminase-like domain-containing protein [Chitinophagales bacterium]